MWITAVMLLTAACLAVPASATASRTASCVVLTDAAGDVAVTAGQPVGHVPSDHADLRSVTVRTSSSELVVTIANTRVDTDRHAIWRVGFTARGTSLFVAGGNGVWANIGDGDTLSGFRAGITGRESRPVQGEIDYAAGVVRIRVPYDRFGHARLRTGTVMSAFTAEAKETLVAVAPDNAVDTELKFSDTGSSHRTVVVGRGC